MEGSSAQFPLLNKVAQIQFAYLGQRADLHEEECEGGRARSHSWESQFSGLFWHVPEASSAAEIILGVLGLGF
ncbi:Golgin subfamily A member 5 [Gossypium arboreum]|uniref:Golgin subfamily A member 5 n=1 Tax=Gossypium arboreum TaxID=29729 RepID=A0A0B0PJN7_GOSAR|nr:Golgin subfamily A member 5 [Gossypium arboreum]